MTKPIVPGTLFKSIARKLREAMPKLAPKPVVEGNTALPDVGEVTVVSEQTEMASAVVIPLFDKEAQEELIDAIGEDAFYNLLAIIPEEADRHLQEIAEAVENGDLKRASIAAHTLKGMASSCTAIRIADAARAIELGVAENDVPEENILSLASAIEETRVWLMKSA